MDEQKKPDISLVDLIERERNALGHNLVRDSIPFLSFDRNHLEGKTIKIQFFFYLNERQKSR